MACTCMVRSLFIKSKKFNKMTNEDNLNVECSGCGAKMSNADFNQHNCPNIIQPIKGESWEDYVERSKKELAKRVDKTVLKVDASAL